MKCGIVLLLLFLEISDILAKSTRIIGGNVATDAPNEDPQFPFAVAVYVTKFSDNVTYFCGGTLIDRHWVITAASCVHEAKIVRIVLGSYRLSGIDSNRFTSFCHYWEIHPDYNHKTAENDLAIVKIPVTPPKNDHIQPIMFTTDPPRDGMDVTVFGWGLTSDKPNQGLSDVLKYVDMNVLPMKTCAEYYKTDFKEDTMICARGKHGDGSCRGDIGGGLIYYVNGHHPTLLAVSSFVYKQGCQNGPSGYTQLYPFFSWIENVEGRFNKGIL